jgi:hypothetical protein
VSAVNAERAFMVGASGARLGEDAPLQADSAIVPEPPHDRDGSRVSVSSLL